MTEQIDNFDYQAGWGDCPAGLDIIPGSIKPGLVNSASEDIVSINPLHLKEQTTSYLLSHEKLRADAKDHGQELGVRSNGIGPEILIGPDLKCSGVIVLFGKNGNNLSEPKPVV